MYSFNSFPDVLVLNVGAVVKLFIIKILLEKPVTRFTICDASLAVFVANNYLLEKFFTSNQVMTA